MQRIKMIKGKQMKTIRGFSLIELMIVVAIVGILAAVAVPSYQSFIQEGRRAEGVALALDIASRQERYYTQQAGYTSNLVAQLGMVAVTSENGFYTAAVVDANGNAGNDLTTYVITVTPAVTDAECGALTYTNIGVRGSANGDAAECWR